MTAENRELRQQLALAEKLAQTLLVAAMSNQQGLAIQGIALNLVNVIKEAQRLSIIERS